jgi:hypothetical protein
VYTLQQELWRSSNVGNREAEYGAYNAKDHEEQPSFIVAICSHIAPFFVSFHLGIVSG